MSNRTFFLISVPEGFEKKLVNTLRNLNAINSDPQENPVVIESVLKNKPRYVALPENMEEKTE